MLLISILADITGVTGLSIDKIHGIVENKYLPPVLRAHPTLSRFADDMGNPEMFDAPGFDAAFNTATENFHHDAMRVVEITESALARAAMRPAMVAPAADSWGVDFNSDLGPCF